MAKTGPAYDLSDAEKRDLIALIEQGKPLPEKYRFILFEMGLFPAALDEARGKGIVFENEWQSFRTRQSRNLELMTAEHSCAQPGRRTVAVKVIDIFGNDTMTLAPANVG